MTIGEAVRAVMKEKGFDGIVGPDCGCTLEDLMPCDFPQKGCVLCKVKKVVHCGIYECEYDGEEHFHNTKDLAIPPEGESDGQ